ALSKSAEHQLRRIGVEGLTGVQVTAIDERGVRMAAAHGAARTVLGPAGVAAPPRGRALGAPVDRAGRVQVEPDLSVPGHPEVFVAGDLVSLQQDGRPARGWPPAALQMGAHAASNVARRLRGEATRPFRYLDKGSLAT